MATYDSISAWATGRPNVEHCRTRTVPEEPSVSVGSCVTWLTACVPTASDFPFFTPRACLHRFTTSAVDFEIAFFFSLLADLLFGF